MVMAVLLYGGNMKKILSLFLLILSAQAETLYVFKGTNGYDVAANHAEFTSFDLGTQYRGGEHPDVARWRQDVRLPFPSVWPALVDKATGVAVPVTGGDVDGAVKSLAAAVEESTPASVKSARKKAKETRGTNTVEQMVSLIESGNQAQKTKAIEDAVKLLLLKQIERREDAE